jgi:hypothetical protein
MSASSPKSRGPELVAAVGALLAVVAVFLPWYATDPASRASNIDGVRGDLSMWTVHEAMRYVLLILLVLIALMSLVTLLRGAMGLHDPSMVLGVNAIGIVLYFGFIYRPGTPMQTIDLAYGYWVALAGVVAPLVVSSIRAKQSVRRSASPLSARA